MTPSQIIGYVSLGLFILVIGGMVIAALVGIRKGAIKMTYKLIMTAMFICIAVFTLKYFADFVGNLNLSFLPYKSVIITNTTTSENYYVPITNLKDTLTGCFTGYYYLFNVNGSEAQAAELALQMSMTLLKFVAFILDMILISTVGNLISALLWGLIFSHVFPKTIRKVFRLRVLAAFEGAVRYLVVIALTLAPFTAIVNAANQAYQHNKSDASTSEFMSTVGGYLDAYNNSIFAQTFFNWTANGDGITLDGQLMDAITSTTGSNGTFSLISEIGGMTGAAVTVGNYLQDSGTITASTILTTDVIDALFAALKDSSLIMMILPIAVTMACNSDLLTSYIDLRYIDMSDADWEQELDCLNVVVDEIIESGVLDNFYDENGNFTSLSSDKYWDVFVDLLDEENYGHFDKALMGIDDSKLLSRALPALMYYLVENNPDMASYFPSTFDAINDISWGFDLDVLYNGLYYLYNDVSQDLCHDLFDMLVPDSGSSDAETDGRVSVLQDDGDSDDDSSELIKEVVEHMDGFSSVFVGEYDPDTFEPLYVDKYGRSDIESRPSSYAGPKYCLADMGLFRYLAPTVLNLLTSALSSSYDDVTAEQVQTDMDALVEDLDASKSGKTPTYMKAYKREFGKMFYVLGSFEGHSAAIDTLMSGEIIPSGGSISDIDKVDVIPALTKLLERMDTSDIFYTLITPLLRSVFTGGDMLSTFSNIGLDTSYITQGFDDCVAEKTLGHELAKIIRLLDYLGPVTDVLDDSSLSSTEQIEQIGALTENLARIMDTFCDCRIFNPENTGDANFLNFIEYIFSLTGTISFDSSLLPDDVQWTNTYDENGNLTAYSGETGHFVLVIKALTQYGLLTKLNDDPSFLSDMDNLSKLVDDYHIDEVFAAVDDSVIFRIVMPDFLDDQLSALDLGLVNEAEGICFHNITSWEEESENLCEILRKSATFSSAMSGGSFAISSLTDDILHDLNDVFHDLADSQLFRHVDGENTEYEFAGWLYRKITPSLSSIEIGGSSYSLISDMVNYSSYDSWPSAWKSAEDAALLSEYVSSYESVASGISAFVYFRDFITLDEASDWSAEDGYVTWNDSFDDAQAASYYAQDELSRIILVLKNARDIIASGSDITSIDATLFENTLTSLNDTQVFRIAIANFYEIASSSLGSGSVSLEQADTSYLVTCDAASPEAALSRDGRQDEIDDLVRLYETYSYLKDSGVMSGGSFDLTAMDSSFDTGKVLSGLEAVQESKVLNRNGPKTAGETTVFQHLVESLLKTDGLSNILYNSSSPKDSAMSALYTDAAGKASLIVSDFFACDGNGTYDGRTVSYDDQLTELSNLIDIMGSVVGVNAVYHSWSGGSFTETLHNHSGLRTTSGNAFDLANVDWDDADNAEAVGDILSTLNESGVLFDAVPNSIGQLLDSVTGTLSGSGLDISKDDFDVYYNYTYPTTDYSRHYDASEITAYQSLFTEYQDFKAKTGGGSISDLSVLSPLIEGTDSLLKSILRTAHDSFSMHIVRASDDTHDYTVFEKLVSSIIHISGLDAYAFTDASTRAAELQSSIQYITYLENHGTTHAAEGTDGYHDEWFGSDGETDAMIGILKTFNDLLGGSGSVDMDSVSIDKLSPANVARILTSINGCDVTQKAVPEYIRSGCDNIHFNDMVVYDGTVRADYDLNCYAYGGTDGSGTEEYCEINNLCHALNGLAQYDGAGNFTSYLSMNDSSALKTLMSDHPSAFSEILRFISQSKILSEGDASFTKNGLSLNGSGVLLYNVMKDQDAMTDYITGTTADEKTAVLTVIIGHIGDIDRTAGNMNQSVHEASALSALIAQSANLTTFNSADASSLADDPAMTSTLLAIVERTYDAENDGTNARAYLSSEPVSHLLNSVLESERSYAAANCSSYYVNSSADFHFGALNYTEFASADLDTLYQNLNQTEHDGLNGSASFFKTVKNATSLSSIDKTELETSFAEMGTSVSSKIIYVSRIHTILRALSYLDGGTLDSALLTESDMASQATSTYRSGWDFTSYGASLAACL